MAITWRTDYAIRLLYELARIEPARRSTVRELSQAAGVPYDYARGIAADLVSAGLLASRRGVHGGVEMARAASDVTLLDIFKALDEPASIALCTGEVAVCDRSGTCPLHNAIWSELDGLIEGYLASVSLESSVEAGAALGDSRRIAGRSA
jgi:Rrf2 family protein